MRTRILAAVIAAGCVAGFEAAASAASDRTPAHSRPVTLIGCVVPAADGAFQLTNARQASMAARRTGSTSAKASAPIGRAVSAIDRPRTAGTTTAKGSAPIGRAPATSTSTASTAATNPKSSTPTPRSAAPTYALDAAGTDVASQAGHMVEVVGALQQRALKVEAVRLVAANCTR
jgi:hypothetical protein